MEKSAFDDLAGKGKPLDLTGNPFEYPLAPTFRRILRDNGVTHPLIEARRELAGEIERCRTRLTRAWEVRQNGGSEAAWEDAVSKFRKNAAELNRSIQLNNLRAPIPNFQVGTLDAEAEIQKRG
jgi:hypothetical protein